MSELPAGISKITHSKECACNVPVNQDVVFKQILASNKSIEASSSIPRKTGQNENSRSA